MKKISFLLFLLFLLNSCVENKPSTDFAGNAGDEKNRYATGFEIRRYENYKEVIVKNPWEAGNVKERYYLVRDKQTNVPADGQKIVVPLHSLGAASCTHFEFLYMLGEGNSLTGICSPQLVYNADIRKRYNEGTIKNMGDAFDLNVEQILMLQPDALMLSGFDQSNEKEKRLTQAGVPVIYNNEWTESTVLARAEWIKFVAAFYDKEALADSLFTVIVNDYNAISRLAKEAKNKPTILWGSNFKGTWYTPGGNTYMARLFADAGADYYYKNDSSTMSLPLSFEMILKNFRQADYWLGCNANRMAEVLGADERHSLFEATKTKQAYNLNNRVTASGGNDFWEGGIAHPDLILKDMIHILHPDLLPEYQPVYMKKIE